MNSPLATHSSRRLMSSKTRFLHDGTQALRLAGDPLVLISALRAPLGTTMSGKSSAAPSKVPYSTAPQGSVSSLTLRQ
jgi:hypothetical protein